MRRFFYPQNIFWIEPEELPREIADEIVALNEESKQLLDEILGML